MSKKQGLMPASANKYWKDCSWIRYWIAEESWLKRAKSIGTRHLAFGMKSAASDGRMQTTLAKRGLPFCMHKRFNLDAVREKLIDGIVPAGYRTALNLKQFLLLPSAKRFP